MGTDKEQAGQVEVFTVDGERWVGGESLCRVLGKAERWLESVMRTMELKSGKDYMGRAFEGNYLFSIPVAQRIIDSARHREKMAAEKAVPKKRRSVEVDEELPPPKRRGELITPWDGFRSA